MSEEFYIELSPDGFQPLRAWPVSEKLGVLVYQGNRPPDQMNMIKVRRIPEEPAKECEHRWMISSASSSGPMVCCFHCALPLHNYLAKALAQKE